VSKVGCSIGVLGLILIVVSVFVAGSVAMLFIDSRHVATVRFDSSLEAASESPIQVDTNRFCHRCAAYLGIVEIDRGRLF
jgi:hypothetical protein